MFERVGGWCKKTLCSVGHRWIPEFLRGVSPVRWPRRIFDAMMEPENGDSRGALFVFILIALSFMAAMFVIAVVAQINKDGGLGTFGDFFGGVLNPVFSFLTFVGLLITIVMQQKEIREAKASSEKQSFETLFFQMITIHNSIVNSMDLRTEPVADPPIAGKEFHGRDCFPRFYQHLKQEIKRAEAAGADDPIQEGYEKFWARDRKDLGHYFRYLYNMIRIVDESAADTGRYMKLLRAQLSDYELIILFYNGLNEKGKRFKPYIEKYAIFDNLPTELLHKNHDLDRYSDGATTDTSIARKKMASDFLATWKRQYIDAEARGLEGLSDTFDEIVSDASEDGISLNELNGAAGGNLKEWLRRAIRKVSGE
ncbi:putative phage abortive infection protein [Neorhizobium galegae]|uniref:putative phage abortive infection protein n=1 Tax=Neorhizobium galegae TaxID=399 RepID=UPI0021057532|nr:putative phage abortive infection protein [Neorhizobium galegae]MCQ1779411.1 putative phage abortive infection protein [Neorhizobium galegae]MCQ1795571.1 putative phage abortive infection protein [Neorhizobium galegae]